jgi:hypothetical protein
MTKNLTRLFGNVLGVPTMPQHAPRTTILQSLLDNAETPKYRPFNVRPILADSMDGGILIIMFLFGGVGTSLTSKMAQTQRHPERKPIAQPWVARKRATQGNTSRHHTLKGLDHVHQRPQSIRSLRDCEYLWHIDLHFLAAWLYSQPPGGMGGSLSKNFLVQKRNK